MKTKGTRDQTTKWCAGFLVGICLTALSASADVVGDWRFNANLNDSSGYGFNGVFHGTTGPTYVTNSGHVALALDGVDQYVSVGANGNLLDFNAESFTIAAWLWVRPVPTPRLEMPIVGKIVDTSNHDYALTVDYYNNTNSTFQIAAFGYAGSGSYAPAPGFRSVADGYIYNDTYLNLVLTYDQPSGTLRIYQNSTLVDTATGCNGPYATAADLQIGNAFGTFLHADIDEIQMYNQSMSGPQITALYNDGNGPIPVPEPTTASMLALAFAVGCGKMWRRKRA